MLRDPKIREHTTPRGSGWEAPGWVRRQRERDHKGKSFCCALLWFPGEGKGKARTQDLELAV